MKKAPVSIKNRTSYAYPDPYVLRWKGKYYCYASGEKGVHVLYSEDLCEFSDCGYAYADAGEHSFWAPAVCYWKGKFFLYYSSLLTEETDDHCHFLRVAVSDSPTGPFSFMRTLTDYFAIDPHVVYCKDHLYIFFAANIKVNKTNGRIGTTVWVDEMTEADQLAGRAHPVLLPDIDQEIYARDRFHDGKDWHTLEGPCYLSDGETSWLMYSGNAYTSPDYFIGYAKAEWDSDLCRQVFKKQPFEGRYCPLIHTKNEIESTGHNSVTQAPDHITPLVVYHGRKKNDGTGEGQDNRMIYIDRLWRQGKMLLSDAPAGNDIKNWPQPDRRFLEDTIFGANERTAEGDVIVSGKSVITLPDKEGFYIEICAYVSHGKLILCDKEKGHLLLLFEEAYWQSKGVLYFHGKLRIRDGEEWLQPQEYPELKSLELICSGEAFINYYDGTFLQTDPKKEAGCLL